MRGIVRIAKNRDENHVILLNENKSFVEQNYHGFHELTHILTVDEPGTTLNCFGNTRPNQNSYIEWLANEGAAEFLMPYKEILPIIRNESKTFDEHSMPIFDLSEKLSNMYNVSTVVVQNRISSCKTTLENIIVTVSAKWKCSNGLFSIQENKSKDKLTGYSIYFEKCLFFKVNTKFTVISCNKRVYDTLEISPAGTKLLKSPQNFIQCTFHTQNEAVKAAELITDENVRIFEPTDHFGCCGLYLKCSDAKKCLHPDIIRSKSCYYKKNLESGKIFYGKNANI